MPAQIPRILSPRIFELIKSLSIFKYLSYGEAPFSRSKTARILPEVKPFILHFKRKDLAIWKDRLQCHNALLARGMAVGSDREFKWLRAKAKSLQFDSLDSFMLHEHSSIIADVLDALFAFSDKVSSLARIFPLAHAWYLGSHLLIQARRWRKFQPRFRALLAHLAEQSSMMPVHCAGGSTEQERLRAALQRATDFRCGDID